MTKFQLAEALARRVADRDRNGPGSARSGVVVLDCLAEIVVEELSRVGPGAVTLPGLLKLKVTTRAATAERQGVDPFTREPRTFAARPARRVVRATPVKALKDAVVG